MKNKQGSYIAILIEMKRKFYFKKNIEIANSVHEIIAGFSIDGIEYQI
jgi:hypothetical protein